MGSSNNAYSKQCIPSNHALLSLTIHPFNVSRTVGVNQIKAKVGKNRFNSSTGFCPTLSCNNKTCDCFFSSKYVSDIALFSLKRWHACVRGIEKA